MGRRKKLEEDEDAAQEVLDLDEMLLSDFPSGTTTIFGTSGQGKTTLLGNILEAKQHQYDVCIVMGGNGDIARDLNHFVDGSFIFTPFRLEDAENIIKGLLYLDMTLGFTTKVCLITDDIMHLAKKLFSSEDFDSVLNQGRHLQLTWINLVQDVMAVKNNFRHRMDILVFFKMSTDENINKIHKYYAGGGIKKEHFMDIHNALTAERSAMVILRRHAKDDSVRSQIFRMKSTYPDLARIPPFTMGVWQMRYLHYFFWIPQESKGGVKYETMLKEATDFLTVADASEDVNALAESASTSTSGKKKQTKLTAQKGKPAIAIRINSKSALTTSQASMTG